MLPVQSRILSPRTKDLAEANVTSHSHHPLTNSRFILRHQLLTQLGNCETVPSLTRRRNQQVVSSKRLPEVPKLGAGDALKKTIKMKRGAIRFENLIRTGSNDRRQPNIAPRNYTLR
jgi:hypothetical protein